MLNDKLYTFNVKSLSSAFEQREAVVCMLFRLIILDGWMDGCMHATTVYDRRLRFLQFVDSCSGLLAFIRN
jgi:hypothetical protein